MNIDDIFDKAKYAVNRAAKKTEDVVELSKLKLESVRMNSDISALYEKLGHSVYDAYKGNYDNAEITTLVCSEIDEMLTRLSDLTNDIADKKNLVLCPTCGFANLKDSFYCAKCGTKIKMDPPFTDYKPEEEVPFTAEAPTAETNSEASEAKAEQTDDKTGE